MINELVWTRQDPQSKELNYTQNAKDLWLSDWRLQRNFSDIGDVQLIEYMDEPGAFYLRDWSDNSRCVISPPVRNVHNIRFGKESCAAGPFDTLEAAQASAEMYVRILGRL